MARAGDGTRFGAESASAVPDSMADQLKIGQVLDGKYRIEGLLGEGGMGAVWWAHHVQLDRPVAIKLLRPGADRATLAERLKVEARAAARLVHPAIVRVFDTDTSDTGEPYIVMELLKGQALSALLERGRTTGVHAVQLLLPIAEGLALAHAQGVVHRDIKPHNVFLAEEGERLQPKLLDFGIAKVTQSTHVTSSLTDTGVAVGSPDYMSPEQARGERDIDYRADIWAFSVVMYETVTGFVPFDGDNYNALMRAIVENDPRPLPLEDGVDQTLADLIYWGLAKERHERPQTVHELGRELARWLIDRGVHEDVCGAPLGPKWITRVAQKSVPVIDSVREPPPRAPTPVVRGDTLVSPRHPNVLVVELAASQASVPRPPLKRPSWPLVAVALALVGGGVWALASRPAVPAPPGATLTAGPGKPALTAGPDKPVLGANLAPRSDPAPTIVQIAPSAASPPTVASAPVADSAASARDKGNSAPAGAASLKPRDAKQAADTPKSPTNGKPAHDAHDETRELLQAY